MFGARTKALVQMLNHGVPAMSAHAYDAAARRVAQGNVAVYDTQLVEILAVHLHHVQKTSEQPTDLATIVHNATQPVPAAGPRGGTANAGATADGTKLRFKRRWKATKRCPKCRSDKGVFGSDRIMRSVDEGAGRKYECMNEECGHVWTVK
jgi:DNA-directed RNA polymerase subunit M/transcription elongation factor TFIIS